MNPRLLVAFAILLVAPLARAGTAPYYINDSLFLSPPKTPPVVDATNFVNNNRFILEDTSLLFPYITPFSTYNTLNFTNRSVLTCVSGFNFSTVPTYDLPRAARSFYNSGSINAATNGGSFFFSGLFSEAISVLIWATNVANPGSINLGYNTLLNVTGNQVDLNRAALLMEGATGGSSSAVDPLDGYWGTGTTNTMFPNYQLSGMFGDVFTPMHDVTYRDYMPWFEELFFTTFNAYVRRTGGGSNFTYQVVYLSNTNSAVDNQVYLDDFGVVVQWDCRTTNFATGLVSTNTFYLTDDFGSSTNLAYYTNGFLNGLPLLQPINYSFTAYQPFIRVPASSPAGLPLTIFDAARITNEWAAYQAIFAPYNTVPGEVYGQDVTNLPGRVELIGNTTLNLNNARIAANNYCLISATNHFVGSSNAVIAAPFLDLNLATTNGHLYVTNIVVPTLGRPEGVVNLYSARWSAVEAATGISNRYEVLFVDSQISPIAKPTVHNLTLRADNVFISDFINVANNLVISARNLTLTTNKPGSPTPHGELNILSDQLLWAGALPNLQNLTNFGVITTLNTARFGPYTALVNHGTIRNLDTVFTAAYFENTGLAEAVDGPMTVTAQTANLLGDSLLALTQDLTLSAASMVASNHFMHAGGVLSLTPTQLLDDGTLALPVAQVTNKNVWVADSGFGLFQNPVQGSLLATTLNGNCITNGASPFFRSVPVTWAAVDRGAVVQGYTNNCALGRLVLTASANCQFDIAGTGTSNAIYVDALELRDGAGFRDANGNWPALNLDTNIVIYYAQATQDGVSIAEKLNHRNGDRLRWISSYTGYYSSTNIVYPDGSTNTFNAALAASCNIDSNNNGVVNCSDPTPFLVASQLGFSIGLTNTPGRTARLSWETIGGATNTVSYTLKLPPTNWLQLTQFVSGPVNLRTNLLDPVGKTNRFYKVTVQVPMP
jgi:hypothetical protein